MVSIPVQKQHRTVAVDKWKYFSCIQSGRGDGVGQLLVCITVDFLGYSETPWELVYRRAYLVDEKEGRFA
jgi:hypothetical protein